MSKRRPKRINPRHRKLIAVLEKHGHTRVRVWWEPLGPAFEMCGHSGGYFFRSDQAFEPIGINFKTALRYVREHGTLP